MTDTAYTDRQRAIAETEPLRAVVVRMAEQEMRGPVSIQYQLVARGLAPDWTEAGKLVDKYYPWP